MSQTFCWQRRGCIDIDGVASNMSDECPHNRSDVYSPCPRECYYTQCQLPAHKTATDLNLILDTEIDRYAAIKQNCYMCEFFLLHGPKISRPTDESGSSLRFELSSDDDRSNVSLNFY